MRGPKQPAIKEMDDQPYLSLSGDKNAGFSRMFKLDLFPPHYFPPLICIIRAVSDHRITHIGVELEEFQCSQYEVSESLMSEEKQNTHLCCDILSSCLTDVS